MGSKKHKGSTATKAVVHQAHEEHTDVDVDGSVAGGARVVDTATIEGANPAGNSTIKIDAMNTTNAAAASNAIAAIAAAAGNAVAATAAAAGNAIAATTATAGDTANNKCIADATAIKGANAAGNSTIQVDIPNTAYAAPTGNSITATVAAAGDGVKVTTDMITTEITEAAMRVIIGKTSAKDTDISSLVRVSVHICRALLYVQSLLLSHYKIILYLNNFTHISLQNLGCCK
jgi:hypothetical protein